MSLAWDRIKVSQMTHYTLLRAILQKWLAIFGRYVDYFRKKVFIVSVRLGAKYASAFSIFFNQSFFKFLSLYFDNTQFLRFHQQWYFSFFYRFGIIYFVKFTLGAIATIFVILCEF